ncbi:MAG: 4-methyl-5(b-hydroxyethyl)-thiazole monophosphate biosynthesis [Oleiphilaceae bacterium]|jgi:4-methyl-5(b-hydroxyethyl)-thiazole monophosphate biosynthesis
MKRILMIVANGVEPLEMAAFTDVMGWATLIGKEKIELVDVGLRPIIKTTFGLQFTPNTLLNNVIFDGTLDHFLDGFDALAIPGGFEPSGFYDEALSKPFLDVIRHFSKQKKVIASVCVSSICLGEAGVLKGKNATTYHQVGGKRKQQLEDSGANFVDHPIVIDGNVITSTGPGTALEVAFKLLERLTDKENTDNLRLRMRVPTPSQAWYTGAQI